MSRIKKCGIYCFQNKLDGKRYIGKSKDIEERYKGHIRASNNPKTHFHLSLNKYGIEAFDFYILEECSIDKLDEREIYYINLYRCLERECGYNMRDGGEGGHGTQEVFDKISASLKGKDTWMKGKHHKESSKKKLSDYNKEHPSYGMLGKHHSEETRKLQSQNRQGKGKKHWKIDCKTGKRVYFN